MPSPMTRCFRFSQSENACSCTALTRLPPTLPGTVIFSFLLRQWTMTKPLPSSILLKIEAKRKYRMKISDLLSSFLFWKKRYEQLMIIDKNSKKQVTRRRLNPSATCLIILNLFSCRFACFMQNFHL